MDPSDLPDPTRWTLVALGAVEGRRIRQARDPVASWLLRRHPELRPAVVAPQTLTMIRARASLIDELLQDEVGRARAAATPLDYWSFGGGFDARWYRLMPMLCDVIRCHYEIEEPPVMASKHELLESSSFATSWERVRQVSMRTEHWTIDPTPGHGAVGVLEGLWTRLGDSAMRALLARIARDAPHARLVLDLPAMSTHGWRERDLAELGWRREEDIHLARRRQLVAPTGVIICAGMEAMRVLRLAGPEA